MAKHPDGETAPTRRPPAPEPVPRGAVAADFFGTVKWVLLVGGAVAVLMGFAVGTATAVAAWAGVGCFAGIAARVMQAEQHHLRGILLVCSFLVGSSTVTATEPQKTEFDIRVTYKVFKDGKETYSKGEVKAFKREVKNKVFLNVAAGNIASVKPANGDQIIEKDGTTWIVEKAIYLGSGGLHVCTVKKAVPKKPD